MIRIGSWDRLALFFSLGCLPLLLISTLPTETQWYSYALSVLIFNGLFLLKNENAIYFQRFIVIVTVFLLGFLWSTALANNYLATIMPYVDKTITVNAEVKTVNTHLKEKNSDSLSYYIQFNIKNINGESVTNPIPISLFWNRSEQPLAGQLWEIVIKTKVIHSYLNEGTFDSQRFAIANRTVLSGKVIDAKLISNQINLRQKIVNLFLPHITQYKFKDILLALAFGDRTQLTEENRSIMMQTGIAHLMAISGMHIILIFVLGLNVSKTILFILPNRYIHFFIPVTVGWLCSLFYVWLSGLNPPALRAILALSFWIFLRYRCRTLTSWQKVIRIIALLLIIDPFMILSESFWLSCYVVICLIFLYQWFPLTLWHYFANRQYKKRFYFIRLLHLQCGLTILLLPIQLLIFQGFSAISIIANMLAIPLISFITFPAILLAILAALSQITLITQFALSIANDSLDLLFLSLEPLHGYWITLSYAFLGATFIGLLLIMVFRTGYWRRFSVTLTTLILILLAPIFKRNEYDWRIDMLDVGHGLATIIHNNRSAILYDTGATWNNSSAAERIILPFLTWHGLTVEGIIISHQDDDHIGGLSTLKQHYPNAWLMSSSAQLSHDIDCITGNKMVWNNISFSVLWPDKLVERAKNSDSCVIKVEMGQFSMLLTGDLEKKEEYQLVERYQEQLNSKILQIPHHGSKTSSTYAFLSKVKPEISLISTSRYNPWNLPSTVVKLRYKELNLPYYITAMTGQITFFITKDSWKMVTLRHELKPRWYHQWFGTLINYE